MMRAFILFSTLALSACAGHVSMTPGKLQAAGSLAGLVQYPGFPIPAMRICARHVQTQAMQCINTRLGQKKYRIPKLPAADYQIMASFKQAELRVGGHMQPVQCIRAPCPDLLKTVSLKPRQKLRDIHINEFYTSRPDFPILPVQ